MEIGTASTHPMRSRARQQGSASSRDPHQRVVAQHDDGEENCENCNDHDTEDTMMPHETPSFIYALGKVQTRFPSLGIEKEFAQATAGVATGGMTDPAALHAVLSEPQNRYLLRHMCWVLTIEGVDTYLLQPSDPIDYALLTNSLTTPERMLDDVHDVDVVIGQRGPLAPPDMCNGLTVPIVMFDQVYSFLLEEFVDALTKKRKALEKDKDKQRDEIILDMLKVPEKAFADAATVTFRHLHQLTDNAGSSDEHRALNYLAVRYDRIYQLAAVLHHQNHAFGSVEVRPSHISSARNIVDVIFAFTSRETGVTEQWYVRVDVSEQYPFLVTPLGRFYDH